jgi:hypothetical protein
MISFVTIDDYIGMSVLTLAFVLVSLGKLVSSCTFILSVVYINPQKLIVSWYLTKL